MEIQNLIKTVMSNNSTISTDVLSKLNIGDSLKAKVIAIASDTIMLELNGKLTVGAKDISTIHYNVGDLVEFTVADIEGEQLFIRSNVSSLALLESKLSESGIEINESNKDLIELLFKNQIPITKENISIIQSTKNYYGKVEQLIKENHIPINTDTFDTNVKETLKNLIQSNDFNESVSQNEQVPTTIGSENNDIGNTNIPFVEEFLNSEDKVTLEKLVFMLKNDLDFNIKDSILIDNLLAGKKTLTNQFENLIKLVDDELVKKEVTSRDNDNIDKTTLKLDLKVKLTNLLNKFQISNLKDKDNFNSVMKDLYEGFEEIKSNLENNGSSGEISKHIEEMKASLDFINKLNESMTFMQMPLNMNDTIKNLDIFIKKNNKSSKRINTSNAKIFISLNTNNLDLVQVLIELNRKDINLNFKVANEKIKDIIKKNENILSSKLQEYDFNNVIFKYNITTEKQDIISSDLFAGKNKLNTLDLRV